MTKRIYFIAAALTLMLFSFYVFSVKAEKTWDEEEDESSAKEEMFSDEEMAAEEMGGSMTGTVISANAQDRMLVLRDVHFGGRTRVFRVQQEATFFGAGSIADLKTGDEITVDFFSMQGRSTVQNVVMEKRANVSHTQSSVEKALISK